MRACPSGCLANHLPLLTTSDVDLRHLAEVTPLLFAPLSLAPTLIRDLRRPFASAAASTSRLFTPMPTLPCPAAGTTTKLGDISPWLCWRRRRAYATGAVDVLQHFRLLPVRRRLPATSCRAGDDWRRPLASTAGAGLSPATGALLLAPSTTFGICRSPPSRDIPADGDAVDPRRLRAAINAGPDDSPLLRTPSRIFVTGQLLGSYLALPPAL